MNICKNRFPEELTEETFGRYLYTGDLQDPDLIVRTGGEWRLSNFLIWQAAYAEYYTTPTYWPDFDEEYVNIPSTSAYHKIEKPL